MSNLHITFSDKNIKSNGHNNGFPRTIIFSEVRNIRRQVSEQKRFLVPTSLRTRTENIV